MNRISQSTYICFRDPFPFASFLFLPCAAKNTLEKKSPIFVAPVVPQFRHLTELSALNYCTQEVEGDGGGEGGGSYSYIYDNISVKVFFPYVKIRVFLGRQPDLKARFYLRRQPILVKTEINLSFYRLDRY